MPLSALEAAPCFHAALPRCQEGSTWDCRSLADSHFLRKEVIQPQVPLRLPCYDFVPLTGHTFDASLSCELGQRLRVQQTQVT